MAESVPLSELGPQLVFYFRPSRRWGTSETERLLERLESVDFAEPKCQADDLFVGELGEIGYDYGLQSLAFGDREFTADDPPAFFVTIDWHGTPSYFVARDCPLPDITMKMGLLDSQPVTRLVKATDIPEVSAFLDRKLGTATTVEPDQGAESLAELEQPAADVPRKGFFARLFGG